MAPNLWKALGRFHGPLTGMVRKCLDGLSLLSTDPTKHNLTQPPGFEYPTLPHPTTGSPSSDIFWAAGLAHLVKNHPGFVSLSDEFWDSRQKLDAINSADLMDTTPDLTDVAYRKLLQGYSPAVGLLKMTVLDRAYLRRTAYNPFALLRVGREAMDACVCPLFLLFVISLT